MTARRRTFPVLAAALTGVLTLLPACGTSESSGLPADVAGVRSVEPTPATQPAAVHGRTTPTPTAAPTSTPTPTPSAATTPTTTAPVTPHGVRAGSVAVRVHSPSYDSPGSPVAIIATAKGATAFSTSVDGRRGECVGQLWTHPEGTSQLCWITLPRESGEHEIMTRAQLPDGRYAVGTHPIAAKGPVAIPVDTATRDRILRCGNGTEHVWLTFDDGFLSSGTMDRMLATLDTENVRARFFATGQWSRANPRMTAALLRAGHLVENHTDTHEALNTIGDEALAAQVARGPRTGATLLRPGFGAGAFTARVSEAAARVGQEVCYWTVDPRDWDRPDAATLTARVLDGNARTPPARPGGVVLLHMTGKHTAEALPAIIAGLRARGLTLEPLR